MTKVFSDIAALIAVLIGLVFEAEGSGADGAAKKAAALAKINAILDQPGGIDWPKYLEFAGTGFRNWFLGFLIDCIVNAANKSGFFAK